MANSKAEKLGLPEEIIVDIVYRLPVKSIGVFRCLSKHWRNFLSDPKFIKAHLTIHGEKEGEQKLIVANVSLLTFTLTQNPHDEIIHVISENLSNLPLKEHWISVGGSCNGLVLVVNKENVKFLINPTTLKYHKIPNFDLALPEEESYCMYGFGYDVVSDDYKVVTLSFYACRVAKNTFVDVYSVRKGIWRRLENTFYDHLLHTQASGVLVNGALHWLADTWLADRRPVRSTVIVAFNLTDENFSEVALPNGQWNYSDSMLVALRGRLCMFTQRGLAITGLCLMKDYGVKESWTIFNVLSLPSLQDIFWIPLCSMTDDDVVIDVNAKDKLMLYDMIEDVLGGPRIDARPFLTGTHTFIDSLVCPSYGAMAMNRGLT